MNAIRKLNSEETKAVSKLLNLENRMMRLTFFALLLMGIAFIVVAIMQILTGQGGALPLFLLSGIFLAICVFLYRFAFGIKFELGDLETITGPLNVENTSINPRYARTIYSVNGTQIAIPAMWKVRESHANESPITILYCKARHLKNGTEVESSNIAIEIPGSKKLTETYLGLSLSNIWNR